MFVESECKGRRESTIGGAVIFSYCLRIGIENVFEMHAPYSVLSATRDKQPSNLHSQISHQLLFIWWEKQGEKKEKVKIFK